MGDVSKWFSRAELQCKCGCGTYNVAAALLDLADFVRDAVGYPLKVRSCCRCVARNTEAGGAKTSSHLTAADKPALAIDLETIGGAARFEVVKAAFEWQEQTGIPIQVEVCSSWVHLGVDPAKKPNILFPEGSA